MTKENDAAPIGTGQEGAGTPTGENVEIPIHIEGEPKHDSDKLNKLADRAARKGSERQHRGDATIFTK